MVYTIFKVSPLLAFVQMWPFRRKNISITDLARMISWGGNGGGISERTAINVADIYSCVRVKANTISQLPFNLTYQDKANGKPVDHPLYQMMRKQPNSWQTAVDFQKFMTYCVNLKGNFYAHINRVAGEIREINPIHPDLVKVKQNNDLSLTYTVSQANKGPVEVAQQDMLHIRGMSSDGIVGLNVVETMAVTFGLASAGARYQKTILQNGGKPSGLLTFPDKLTDENYKKETERIEKAVGGENSGGTLILDRGVTFSKITLSAADLQLLETMRVTRQQICGIIGVPPFLIGDFSGASWSNVEQQNLSYHTHDIAPEERNIEQSYDRDLLTAEEKRIYEFKANPDALLRGDSISRATSWQLGIMNGIFCPDDIRAMQDLGPRTDGLGGQYFYQANLMPAEMKPWQDTTKKSIEHEN